MPSCEISCREFFIDLGCGYGSLFDALLDKKTNLVYIVDVNISRSLIHDAKVLHSKLDVDHKS